MDSPNLVSFLITGRFRGSDRANRHLSNVATLIDGRLGLLDQFVNAN